MRRLIATILVGLSSLVLVVACTTYREHLNRGQRLYDENEYERALAIWRALEADRDSLTLNEQARYAYFRGMTDYRLGFRPDARHWLALAKAIEQEHSGGLTSEWKRRTEAALADLNKDVYGRSALEDSTSSAVERTRGQDGGVDKDDEEGEGQNDDRHRDRAGEGDECRGNAECPPDQRCRAGTCVSR